MKHILKSLFVVILAGVFIISGKSAGAAAETAGDVQTAVSGSAIKLWQQKDQYITSGIYTYRMINGASKDIEIRYINSSEPSIEIPVTIDGCRVVSIGYSGDVSAPESELAYNADDLHYIGDVESLRVKGCETTLKEIILPPSVKCIGACAFRNFEKLESVKLNDDLEVIYGRSFEGCKLLNDINIPANAVIGQYAFYDCPEIKKLTLTPENIDAADGLFNCGSFEEIHFTYKKGDTVDIIVSLNNNMFGAFTKIKRVIIDPKYPCVELSRNVGVIVIKGKKTKVVSYRAHDAFDKTVIATVKGAKAINFAKKNKMSYKIRQGVTVKKLTCKKAGKGFIYTWKKSKPAVVSYRYNTSKKRWIKKGKPKYIIYGSNKKNGKYRKIASTGKTEYNSRYKYIKIEVNEEY